MSDWRSLKRKHGFLPSTYVLDRAGVNANGREDFLPLEGAHIDPVQLFFRNTQTNGIGTKYDAITTAGSSPDTSVTNTTAGGTEIQATKTAGGSVVEFISGRTPVGGGTFTSAVIYFWAKESADTVNAGIRFRIYKRTNAGIETELTGSPFDKGVELSTINTLYEVTCNFADTALAEDDRLVFKPYIVNIGTMAVGTVTLRFNGATTALTGAISVLTVTDTGTGTVDLTALGGADYHIYDSSSGLNVGQRKATGGSSITVAEYDPSSVYTTDFETKSRTASATDATPTTNFNGVDVARVFNATALPEGGFKITLPAGLGERTAKIFVQAYHASDTTERFQAVASISDGSATDKIVGYAVPATGTDYYLTLDLTYKAAHENQTIDIIWKFVTETSTVTRTVQYLASWVSTEGTPPALQAGSYVDVYPAVTFKAEGGGTTVVDLNAATWTFTKQNPQLKATAGLGTRSFTFTGKAMQSKLTIAHTAAALTFSAKAMQSRVSNNLTAATLSFSAKAAQTRLTVALAAAALTYSAKALQNRISNNLTAAALSFSAKAIDAFNTGGAVVVDLTSAAFGFVAHTVQTKVTVPLALAALTFSAKALQLRATVGLTLASLLTSAKTLQLRATVALTAAQNRLTSQAIGARLALTMTVANTLRFITNTLQNRLTVTLTKANLYFLPQVIDVVGEGVAAIVVRFRYSLTRFRQILKSRKY